MIMCYSESVLSNIYSRRYKMKLKKRLQVYINVAYFVFIVLFIIYVVLSNHQYNNLLKVCDDKSETLKEQEALYDRRIKYFINRCDELTAKNSELVEENFNLRSKLKRVKLPTYEYSEYEVYLLSQCVEAEAGYYEGHSNSQKYIAQVILNRVRSGKFPNTIREVIHQKDNGVPQFSVAYDGSINREVKDNTLANVYSVLVNGTNLPEYVCYFYSAKVKENWVNTLPIYDTVEGTVFAYESKEDY